MELLLCTKMNMSVRKIDLAFTMLSWVMLFGCPSCSQKSGKEGSGDTSTKYLMTTQKVSPITKVTNVSQAWNAPSSNVTINAQAVMAFPMDLASRDYLIQMLGTNTSIAKALDQSNNLSTDYFLHETDITMINALLDKINDFEPRRGNAILLKSGTVLELIMPGRIKDQTVQVYLVRQPDHIWIDVGATNLR